MEKQNHWNLQWLPMQKEFVLRTPLNFIIWAYSKLFKFNGVEEGRKERIRFFTNGKLPSAGVTDNCEMISYTQIIISLKCDKVYARKLAQCFCWFIYA